MDNWKTVVIKGMVPGTVAGVASAAALALCSSKETGSAPAAMNAVSHYAWGREAFQRNTPSWKYTLVGYAFHHASAHFWASIFEQTAGKVLDRKSPGATLAAGMAASAVACLVDYKVTPRALHPGYEKRVSRRSLAVVYTVFGLGLALGAWLNRAGAR
ncbi:hypothetical protein ACLB1G_17585 [Oxalobacteraceae bacterium A2-2]